MNISKIIQQQNPENGFSVYGVNGYAGEQDGSHAVLTRIYQVGRGWEVVFSAGGATGPRRVTKTPWKLTNRREPMIIIQKQIPDDAWATAAASTAASTTATADAARAWAKYVETVTAAKEFAANAAVAKILIIDVEGHAANAAAAVATAQNDWRAYITASAAAIAAARRAEAAVDATVDSITPH